MANIGTFTAEKDGFTGTLRTLTLNVKVKLVPNDKGDTENAPDFHLQAAGHEIGAAWKKTSEAGREYLSVSIDDPSFPATIYARLIEGENESAPDFRLQAAGHDFGAAWKKTSEAGRDYLSVAIDDPSFPATIYARLIEGENGTHDLIWSRSKPKAA